MWLKKKTKVFRAIYEKLDSSLPPPLFGNKYVNWLKLDKCLISLFNNKKGVPKIKNKTIVSFSLEEFDACICKSVEKKQTIRRRGSVHIWKKNVLKIIKFNK